MPCKLRRLRRRSHPEGPATGESSGRLRRSALQVIPRLKTFPPDTGPVGTSEELWLAGRDRGLACEHRDKLLLREHLNAMLLGILQLGTGTGAGDDVIRLLADA